MGKEIEEKIKEAQQSLLQELYDFYAGDNDEGFCDFQILEDLKGFADKYHLQLEEWR